MDHADNGGLDRINWLLLVGYVNRLAGIGRLLDRFKQYHALVALVDVGPQVLWRPKRCDERRELSEVDLYTRRCRLRWEGRRFVPSDGCWFRLSASGVEEL